MNIQSYVDDKLEPSLKEKVIGLIKIDELGEPYVCFNYKVDKDTCVNLESFGLIKEGPDQINNLKLFAQKVTLEIGRNIKVNPMLRLVVLNCKSGYFKHDINVYSHNDKGGYGLSFLKTDDILFGIIVDPEMSKKISLERKIAMLEKCLQSIKDDYYNKLIIYPTDMEELGIKNQNNVL